MLIFQIELVSACAACCNLCCAVVVDMKSRLPSIKLLFNIKKQLKPFLIGLTFSLN